MFCLISILLLLQACNPENPVQPPQNAPPRITGFFALPAETPPGGTAKVTVEAGDPDSDALEYAWSASGGSIDGTGTTVTWHAPVHPKDSTFIIRIEVNDSHDGRAQAALEIPIVAAKEAGACAVPCDQIIRVGPARCEDCIGLPGIPALQNPAFVSAEHPDADYLTDASLVIGLVRGSEARAYPVLILNRHEVVNDVFAGERITVTYCPFTSTPIVFSRETGPASGLDFEVSGFLYNSNLILYDLQEQTLWSQMRMQAIRGRRLGQHLDVLPAYFMNWAAWKRLYPGTRVLSKHTGYGKNYAYNEYSNYNTSPYIWAPIHHEDNRLHVKTRVYGMQLGGRQKAYAWNKFAEKGILLDTAANGKIIFIWDRNANFAAAYYARTSHGETEFILQPGDEMMLQDARTGSLWDMSGLARSGPLAGERLQMVLPAYPAFWFAWAAVWPETELMENDR